MNASLTTAWSTLQGVVLIIGILGAGYSILLIFLPQLTGTINRTANRSFHVDDRIAYIDKEVPTSTFLYNNHYSFGCFLVLGSLILLAVCFRSNSADVIDSLSRSIGTGFAHDLIFQSALWIGRITGLLGLAIGVAHIFKPDKMRQIEAYLNVRLETQRLVNKLNDSSYNLDKFLSRNPRRFGLIGFSISAYIIISAIVHFG